MSSKKLLVFSDSHGRVTNLKAVFEWANDHIPPYGTIHAVACLGDGLSDLQKAANATGFYSDWKLVKGNNDYGIQAPDTAVFDFSDHRFFMCHGHRHGLYEGYNSLITSAQKAEADVVLFGHTHSPYYKNIDDILLINPGSIGSSRSRVGETFAVIECIEDHSLNVKFLGIDNNRKIYEVSFQ
jgi:putative phosphoesterase